MLHVPINTPLWLIMLNEIKTYTLNLTELDVCVCVLQVLVLPTGEGRECGSLIDVENCKNIPACDFLDPRPDYSWHLTPWTSCRKVWTHLYNC